LESYQTSPDDYLAIREHAALGAIAPRAQIGVGGKDRAAYLQGLLTHDILALTAGTGCYAAWLTPQGRMLTDMHVFESGDMILLDVPADQLQPTLQRLDQFLFSEDVQLADLAGTLRGVWVHGPEAASVVEAVVHGVDGLVAWTEYRNGRAEFGGNSAVVARVDQLGVPGFCIYVAPREETALIEALQRAGARVVNAAALEAARIEAGYPLFGIDMTEDTIPLEAGIEQRAISFTKGCYVGQEIIIRVLHRGQGRVARRLMALRVDGEVPARGAKLFAGAREVGVVTSAAYSPSHGAIALGYLHRDFTAPGMAVEVEHEGARSAATVIESPVRGVRESPVRSVRL
jgi:tRNA-modifying protein YgfZ